jgi:hypothetical protein
MNSFEQRTLKVDEEDKISIEIISMRLSEAFIELHIK